MSLESMQNQFSGLPMGSLIGSPLKAACDAQMMLAKSTVDFIREVGFDGDRTRTADFSYTRHIVTGKDGLGNDIFEEENIGLEIPVLAIVNIPSLMVDEVDITFDMEVKSSESSHETEDKTGKLSAKAKVGWGILSVSASISGSVASHKENTRSSDNSAKYHVQVHASQAGTPEGLSRVLDIIQDSIAPRSIAGPNQALLENGDIKEASEKVVLARNELKKANSDLMLSNMKLEHAKSANLDIAEAEEEVTSKKLAISEKEIALQVVLNDLQDKVATK